MLGFGAFPSAQRFCQAFEEVRQYFGPAAKESSSSRWPTADDNFCSERGYYDRCSWPHKEVPLCNTARQNRLQTPCRQF